MDLLRHCCVISDESDTDQGSRAMSEAGSTEEYLMETTLSRVESTASQGITEMLELESESEPETASVRQARVSKWMARFGQQTTDHDHAEVLEMGTGGISKLTPKRPYWEPPDFDYSRYQLWLEAEKAVNERKGSADIEWRTMAMDLMVEKRLNEQYGIWARLSLDRYSLDEVTLGFLEGLAEELSADQREITKDIQRLNARRMRRAEGFYKTYHELQLAEWNIARDARFLNPMAEKDAEEEG